MKLETVLFEREDRVGIIRLNRPERMNAVIEQMYTDIQTVLNETRENPDIRVLVLTGTVWRRKQGEKQAFCAGADLKKHAEGSRTPWEQRAYINLAHETTRLIYEFPKVVIAAINGPARGAGTEMALNCDLVFMADTATLAFSETGLGTMVGGGATSHLTRLVGSMQAKALVYSGRLIDGPEAVRLGLALESVPVERLRETVLAYAKVLSDKAPISMAFAKELLNRAPLRDLPTVLLAEAEAILACMNTDDWREGNASFTEKRAPVFKGR